MHKGIDVVIPDDVVTVCCDGVVRFAGQWKDEYSKTAGKVVVLNHYDVNGAYQGVSRYYHLNELFVKTGDKVSIGQEIGLQGWTGSVYPPNEQGKHLHFQINDRDGNAIDPLPLINMKGSYQQVMQYKHWDEENFVFLNQNGIRWYERRPNDYLTRAEARALQVRELKNK